MKEQRNGGKNGSLLEYDFSNELPESGFASCQRKGITYTIMFSKGIQCLRITGLNDFIKSSGLNKTHKKN